MTTSESPHGRPGRRAVLKGAVAAGVGVAAWSAPDISTLGFTPAYAVTCSTPAVVGSSSADVNCPGGCGPHVSLGGNVVLGALGGGLSNTRVRLGGPGCADGTRVFEFFAQGAAEVDLDCVINTVILDGVPVSVDANTPVILATSPDCQISWSVTATCCPVL